MERPDEKQMLCSKGRRPECRKQERELRGGDPRPRFGQSDQVCAL